MSFYGNVFYEFKNLFSKFKFLNEGLNINNANLEVGNSKDGTSATQNWDVLHMESGNQWIGLQSLPETGTHKGVKIFHRTPGETKVTYSSFDPVDTTGEVLGADQAFEIANFKVDDAGHISSIEKSTYQLPSSSKIVQNGLQSYYDSRGVTVPSFEAEGEEEADVIELSPGQKIDVSVLDLTSKGIVSNFSTKTYQLPMSDTEKDYSEIKERVEVVEDTVEGLVEELNTTIPETYTTLAESGVVEDLYNTDTEQQERFNSITEGIGNLEASSKTIFEEDKTVYSISEQLIKMYSIVTQAKAEVATYATAIEGLQARVKILEAEVEELKAAQTE